MGVRQSLSWGFDRTCLGAVAGVKVPFKEILFMAMTLRLLNTLNSEDRGLKVRFFPCDDSI